LSYEAYREHGSLVDSGAIVHIFENIHMRFCKVVITTGPLGLPHELITQKFAADIIQITSIKLLMPEELARQSLQSKLQTFPSASEDTSISNNSLSR
jgi:hypothetical protein